MVQLFKKETAKYIYFYCVRIYENIVSFIHGYAGTNDNFSTYRHGQAKVNVRWVSQCLSMQRCF